MPHVEIKYVYALRYKYPHMKPADILIWERFIAANPSAYEFAEYDYLVGSPAPFDTTVNPETGGSDEALYRRKIDAVGHRKDGIDIIELKPRAGPSALGQVKGYQTLYVRDEKPTKPTRAVVITDVILPDMQELADAQDVVLLTA